MDMNQVINRYLELAEMILQSEEITLSQDERDRLLKTINLRDVLIDKIKNIAKDNNDPMQQRIKSLYNKCLGTADVDDVLLNELGVLLKRHIDKYLLFYEEKWIEYGVYTKIAFVDAVTDRARYEPFIKKFDPQKEKPISAKQMLAKFTEDWKGVFCELDAPYICEYRLYKRVSWVTRSSIYSTPMMTVSEDEIKKIKGGNSLWKRLKQWQKKI